jgi:hypothetical protein
VQIVAQVEGDLWADTPRPPGHKKRWNRIVIASASAVRGLAEHCQAMDAVVAGCPLRVSPQAHSHPDYSIVITDYSLVTLLIWQGVVFLSIGDPLAALDYRIA